MSNFRPPTFRPPRFRPLGFRPGPREFITRHDGLHRVADDGLDQFELYIGQDAPPDFTAPPAETFTSLPHTTTTVLTPPGSGTRVFQLVTRKRNRYDLLSQNIIAELIEIDSGGVQQAVKPSDPQDVSVVPAVGGTILVTANYFYTTDPAASQADEFAIYSRTDGTDPDPSADTPTIVAMIKIDGVAKLTQSFGPFADTTPFKAIVRTRINASGVESPSLTVFSTAAETGGPPAPIQPGAFVTPAARQEHR